MADMCGGGTKFESDFKLIKQGAEAKLYEGTYLGRPTIVKERFKKSYRHVDLDNHLTKERMKSEARAVLRCKLAGIYLFSLEFCRFRGNIFALWWLMCGPFYVVVAKLFLRV
jgi:TP53 regulating kinase-like protein